ncbi:hypothetical protein BGZ58_002069 [Dissophora ornata]|nr:hypothetical protein BGZ58_002069 [Dissophora ornata]
MPSPAAAAASKGVPTISSTALNLQSRQGATSVPASPNAKPSIAQSTEPSNLSAGQSRKAPRVLSNNSIPVAGPVSMVRLSAVALSPANLGHTSAASVTEISTPPATPKASTVSTIPTTTTVQVPIGPTTPTQSIKNKPAPALPSPSITSLPLQTMETLPTEYRLNCDIHTVNDVWREWTVGLGGGPSIKSLNERFELSWLHPEDQEQYMELRSLVLEVERLMTRKGVKESLDLLEHARVMSAVDIHVFMETLRMRGLQGVKDLIQKQMVEQVGVKA